MRHFENQTDGLRHLLRLWSTEAVAWVGFPADPAKLDAIAEKWAERFGTNLPTHVRHERRRRGQPNAYAFSHRIPRSQKVQVWLLRTDGQIVAGSAWAAESWKSNPPEIGDSETRLVMVREPRPRRDYAWTWRLGPKHLNLIGSHWRTLVESGDADGLRFAVASQAKGLPMFGGIRRQLAGELERQRRRWLMRWPSKPWPGPKTLPMMGRFKTPTLGTAGR